MHTRCNYPTYNMITASLDKLKLQNLTEQILYSRYGIIQSDLHMRT